MPVPMTLSARLGAFVSRAALAVVVAVLSLPALADDSDTALPDIVVKETPTVAERYKLPNTSEGITADKMADTVNVIDPEDAVKYMPSLFVRKRNNGDTQAILATRTWGVNSSARSLVYADDIPISALLANDNSRGGPRWGLVAPEEISRVDMMYGPFAASEAGNSMGGILRIVTRTPDRFEVTGKQTESFQTFSLYGTKDTYRTDQTSASVGDRIGKFAFFLSANNANSFSQPLSAVTSTTAAPAGTTGQISAVNKSGATANVIGAGGLLHTDMDTIKAKFVYDLTPEIQASYILGYWQNHGRSRVESYLKDSAGNTTYGTTTNGASFASSNYILEQAHTTHAISLKSDTKGNWDFDMVATHYQYDRDTQAQPAGITGTGAATFTNNGTFTQMDGTNWSTADAKAIWRPEGMNGAHEASFGAHYDRYILVNTTYTTANWQAISRPTGVSTDSRGNTQTTALWAQDVWKIIPDVKATLGGRYEYWNTFDGHILDASGVNTMAPWMNRSAFSPKGSLSWDFLPQWSVTGSAAEATRFPTVTELYQTTSTAIAANIPNPRLKPERVKSYELALERDLGEGKLRVSLFQENVDKALISQSTSVNGVATTVFTNVDEVQNRGVELAAQQSNVVFDGLDLSGSVTYVDSETLRDSNWAGGTQVNGKRVPYVPMWRGTFVTTFRPTEEWAMTAAARYRGKMSTTLDNTDYVHHVMGAFDPFFVIDLRAHYKYNDNLEAAFGVDNVNNEKYYEYHPFPQRTFIGELKMKL